MIKTTALTTLVTVQIPTVPNFLISAAKEDVVNTRFFRIEDFTDNHLQQIADAWTQNLLEKARQRRNKS